MKIIFCTSNKIGAQSIRVITWSDWSHVGIIIGDEVIEAVYPRVKATPLREVIANHTRYCIVDIPCPNDAAAINAALSQIGKLYDLKGMLGLGINRDWQDDRKWWCSELVAWVILQGGLRIFRDGVMHRITPQHLFMLNFVTGE